MIKTNVCGRLLRRPDTLPVIDSATRCCNGYRRLFPSLLEFKDGGPSGPSKSTINAQVHGHFVGWENLAAGVVLA
jgi:hypothetical protein